MKQLRKHTAGNLNQILKSEMAAGLTIDGSALSVNIVGLEGQDAALTQAIAAAEYVVCIIGWYPASRNANRDTNANATTRSLKSHLWELLGCEERPFLVYWVDCWQFCHDTSNASMNYGAIKTFLAANFEARRLCADLLAINIAIAEAICGNTPTWVVNGVGETLDAFLSIFPSIPINGDVDPASKIKRAYSSNTDIVRKIYEAEGRNLRDAIKVVKMSISEQEQADVDAEHHVKKLSTLNFNNEYYKKDINVIIINQHLSYHLMRHDASGKSPGLTLDEDICNIVMDGGCYNLTSDDTPKTMREMKGRRLVAMLKRLDAVTRVVLNVYNMELSALYVDIVFQLRPSLLYMPGAERAVKFLTENHLLLKPDRLVTFSCDGFWSCANRDDAWKRALRFLDDGELREPDRLVTFSCDGF